MPHDDPDVRALAQWVVAAHQIAHERGRHIFGLPGQPPMPRTPDYILHPRPVWPPPGLANETLHAAWYVVAALAHIVEVAANRHPLLAALQLDQQQCVRALASDVQHLDWLVMAGLAQPLLCHFSRLQALKLRGAHAEANSKLRCVPQADAHGNRPSNLLKDRNLKKALQRLWHLDLRDNLLGDSTPNNNAFVNQLRQHACELTLLCLQCNPLQGDTLVFAQHDLPHLAHLDVSSCQGLADHASDANGFGVRGVRSLPHLAQLTHVKLADTNLSMHEEGAPALQALGQLQRLRHLDLSNAVLHEDERLAVREAAQQPAGVHCGLV